MSPVWSWLNTPESHFSIPQAICSFVPSQIEFEPLKDTQPFGGLHSSSLEAALNASQTVQQSSSLEKNRPAPVSRNSTGSRTQGQSGSSPLSCSDPTVATDISHSEGAPSYAGFDRKSINTAHAHGTATSGVAAQRRLPYDAVLFFHGLNGLELACERGNVSEGTCVLFNGASLLLEDELDMTGKRWLQGREPPAVIVAV